jgi:hypothetical protein
MIIITFREDRNMAKYVNYGDENPIEHGGLFIARDEEIKSSPCFYVIEVNPLPDLEDTWVIWESYIDLNDVTQEQLSSALEEYDEEFFSNMDEETVVSALIQYFGHTTFSDGTQTVITGRDEVIKDLKERGINHSTF